MLTSLYQLYDEVYFYESLLLKLIDFYRASANSGLISTIKSCDSSSRFLRAAMALWTMAYMPCSSRVKRTSQIHFLSKWFHPLSSGRCLNNLVLPLAKLRKSSTESPSICGTAATLTRDLFIY